MKKSGRNLPSSRIYIFPGQVIPRNHKLCKQILPPARVGHNQILNYRPSTSWGAGSHKRFTCAAKETSTQFTTGLSHNWKAAAPSMPRLVQICHSYFQRTRARLLLKREERPWKSVD